MNKAIRAVVPTIADGDPRCHASQGQDGAERSRCVPRSVAEPKLPNPPRINGAGFDEVADERPVLVERRPVAPTVLLEREGQRLAGVVELAQEVREGTERERAERVLELRRANGHAPQLGALRRIPVRRAREVRECLLVQDDRAAPAQLHDSAALGVTEDAVDGRT